MNHYLHGVFLAAILLLIRYLKIQVSRRRIIAYCKCGPTPKIPSKDIFGLSNLQGHIEARRANCWPSFLENTLDSAGKNVHTASHRAFTVEMFYTRDPENFKAILSAPESDYTLGPARGPNFEPVVGSGLLTADGERWHHYRRCARPLFTRKMLELNLEVLERILPRMWPLPTHSNNGWTEEMDIRSVSLELALDVTMELLSAGSSFWQENPSVDSNKVAFCSALDEVASYTGNRTILGKLFWIKQSRAFRRNCRIVQDFVDAHICGVQSGTPGPHGTEASLRQPDITKTPRNAQRDLQNQIQPFLFAGRSATAAAITATIYFLLKNPSIYQKLRTEVLLAFPSRENINLSNLGSCQYLNFCINESLRLASVVPAIIRTAEKDSLLPRGGGSEGKDTVLVPKGSPIIMSIQGLHLRQDIWGLDAASFNPERWSLYRFNWNFLPFSKGRRRCVGQQLVLNQATYTIARLVQQFDALQSNNDSCTIKHKTDFNSTFMIDAKIRFHVASR